MIIAEIFAKALLIRFKICGRMLEKRRNILFATFGSVHAIITKITTSFFYFPTNAAKSRHCVMSARL